MGKFNKIRTDTFETIQTGAGVLMSQFDVSTATMDTTKIIGATTGGLSFSATPAFSDYGEDIDNCPKNTKELKRLDDWEVKCSGTFITIDESMAQRLTALADVTSGKITPRDSIDVDNDFKDLWIVADYGDSDGLVAVHMMNTLSTGGFSMQTQDKSKGQFAFEFTAHYSIDAQDTVPFEVYVKASTT